MNAGLEHYRHLFSHGAQQAGYWRRELDRASLPSPLQYLTKRGALVGKPRGEWALIRCPAHKGGDERNPSMSVSLVDGHFACHACGAKGSDIVKLHMLATHQRFPEAVRDLGGRFHDR